MYTVIVNLQVKPDMVDAFLEAMGENPRASRRDEPGCLRFDVHRDNDDPNHFVLYEQRCRRARLHRGPPRRPPLREVAGRLGRAAGAGRAGQHLRHPAFPGDLPEAVR